MQLRLHEVGAVVGATNDYRLFPDVSLSQAEFDSRLIGAGDLFIPLKGERDGHDFITVAFENGAAATLTERAVPDGPYLQVDDVLRAFQCLAAYYLEKMRVDVLAVTGSNGKTTTKDMLAHLLTTTYPTYKTQGNYNNEIGLPYTVLHMPEDTEKLVLEMGQDHLGDIAVLSRLARPKSAVVTLVGEAHLAFFDNRKQIAEGKLQIADGLRKNGVLLVPTDEIVDEFLPEKASVVRFGDDGDIFLTRLVEEKQSVTFETNFLSGTISLPVTGKYNATNAMVAAYLALKEGVDEKLVRTAFADLHLTRNRTEWKKAQNGADILSDVYNANPTAMRLILETFSTIPANEGGRKIVVLADMKELGSQSLSMHAEMADSLSPDCFAEVFLYGEDMAALYQVARTRFSETRLHYFVKNDQVDEFDSLCDAVKETLGESDQVLIKGSNSMNLAQLVERLEE